MLGLRTITMFVGMFFMAAVLLTTATASSYKPTENCSICVSRVRECIKMCKDRYEEDMSLACKVACECKISKSKKFCGEKCGLGCEGEIGIADVPFAEGEE
ncbi:hypothetical protein EKO04_009186 [Ascochyta lentis]|uniref:Uncharacterized protein n=1 Tax=Ascochyta lentis TaxID=205686 RepID=A0A8H7ME66_9PLEO|nr:hypothetical protein EKO04_009186 [Ascochyta lentis]